MNIQNWLQQAVTPLNEDYTVIVNDINIDLLSSDKEISIAEITSLHIDFAKIADSNDWKGFHSIKTLKVTECLISPSMFTAIASIQHLEELIMMDVYNILNEQNFSSNDIAPIFQMEQLISLCFISMSLSSLPNCINMPKLEELDLTANTIRSLSFLETATPMLFLKTLDISMTLINDIKILFNPITLPVLELLYTGNGIPPINNSIKEEDLLKLKSRRPQLSIWLPSGHRI